MSLRLLRSQAVRIAAVLTLLLAAIEGGFLMVSELDRTELARLGQARAVSNTVMSLYRTVLLTPAEERIEAVQAVKLPRGFSAVMAAAPPTGYTLTPAPIARLLRADMSLVPLPPGMRPREYAMLGGFGLRVIVVGIRMPDGGWLNVTAHIPALHPWSAPNFLPALGLMVACTALVVFWAVWRLSRPILLLSAAADRLGRDVNAPPLLLSGPAEFVRAASAFNLMAERIRRFVQDRTFLLSAIGHDLRTPITRLKLRAEFIDDEDMQRRMLNDLEELEAMVNATMVFGRDVASSEPMGAVDLAVLVRTVLDEAGDARPEVADNLLYKGPEHLTVQARPLALKRALANLIGNAVNYGGTARVKLEPPPAREPAPGSEARAVRIVIEDDGPGIPPEELPKVFEPFHRAEASRNKETGGFGLGLPIARNILRAHGGDVTLANRPEGGAQALVLLPV